nr:zinc finger, CCHC-type [Tanacetum cinerariifolium]
MEYEIMALAAGGKEAEWLRNMILEISLWFKPITPISICCDSAATLAKAYVKMYNEDTFSIRMVELMNNRQKAIAEMKAKAKREKPMTPTQQKEFMRTFEPTSISAGVPIAAGDPIPAATSVSTGSFIHVATPIVVGVSTTAGTSASTSEAFVPIIKLLNSPPKETSLPLDSETKEQDAPLRKSLRKKSIAKKRTLPSLSQPKYDALLFYEDDPEAEFKRRGVIHVSTRADGTVKKFSTLRELMYWAGRVDLMVLYGLVLDKYKMETATSIGLGLWMDLRILITFREERYASIIWDDQDQW